MLNLIHRFLQDPIIGCTFQAKYAKNSNSYIFRSLYQIDMKFDRQLRPATETSYGGKTIPTWRTAAIYKIDISPYLSEKSSEIHEILYTADFELDERHAIKMKKLHWTDSEFDRTYFLLLLLVLTLGTLST